MLLKDIFLRHHAPQQIIHVVICLHHAKSAFEYPHIILCRASRLSLTRVTLLAETALHGSPPTCLRMGDSVDRTNGFVYHTHTHTHTHTPHRVEVDTSMLYIVGSMPFPLPVLLFNFPLKSVLPNLTELSRIVTSIRDTVHGNA